MALPVSVLTTLATVKDELGITDATEDIRLERYIQVASDAIVRYCRRKLHRETGIIEKHAGAGFPRLFLDRLPLVSVTEVKLDESVITDFDLVDLATGLLYRDAGWTRRAFRAAGIVQQPVTGTDDENIQVTYVGGFITPEGDPGQGTRDLPLDIEQACIDTVTSIRANRSRDSNITAEKLGDASVTYGGVNSGAGQGAGGLIPDGVIGTLKPYRRLS